MPVGDCVKRGRVADVRMVGHDGIFHRVLVSGQAARAIGFVTVLETHRVANLVHHRGIGVGADVGVVVIVRIVEHHVAAGFTRVRVIAKGRAHAVGRGKAQHAVRAVVDGIGHVGGLCLFLEGDVGDLGEFQQGQAGLGFPDLGELGFVISAVVIVLFFLVFEKAEGQSARVGQIPRVSTNLCVGILIVVVQIGVVADVGCGVGSGIKCHAIDPINFGLNWIGSVAAKLRSEMMLRKLNELIFPFCA